MECNDPEPPAKSHQTNCKRKLVKNLTGPGWCSLVELSSLYSTAGTAVYPRHFHPEGGNKQPAGGAPSDGLHLPLTLSGQNIDKSSLRKCFHRALVVVAEVRTSRHLLPHVRWRDLALVSTSLKMQRIHTARGSTSSRWRRS